MTSELQTIVEVLILATIYYGFIRHLQTTRGGALLAGFIVLMVAAFALFAVVLRQYKLPHLQWLANAALPALGIGLLVIFQPELRLAIARLGNIRLLRALERFFGTDAPVQRERVINAIVEACKNLSETRTGALIVVQRREGIEGFSASGVRLNAEVSARFLENIFYKGAPLHDGAVLIMSGRVMYAACHLPSPTGIDPQLSDNLGTRHRAALGLSEQSDAVVVIVSEETGKISIAQQGKLKFDVDLAKLRSQISVGISVQLEVPEAEKPADLAASNKKDSDEEVEDMDIDIDVAEADAQDVAELPK